MATAAAVAAAVRRDLTQFLCDRVGVVVESIHDELTSATPKDTGFGAGSYFVDLGPGPASPSGLEDQAANSRALRAIYAGSSEQAARASLAQAINSFKLKLTQGVIVPSVNITNWTWYVDGRLDQGSSPKAPAGFIYAAIERGVAKGV